MAGARKDEEMFEARDVDVATSERQEVDAENVPDEMEGEQTWPTEEEMMSAEQKVVIRVRFKININTFNFCFWKDSFSIFCIKKLTIQGSIVEWEGYF